MKRIYWVVKAVSVVACSFALAQDWAAPVSGSWDVEGNWSGGAVPPGNAALFFTNAHGGTVEVALDGDRAQDGRMTFGGGDWRLAPGTPSTSAFTNLGGGLTVKGESAVAFAVPTQLGNAARYLRDGAGEWRLEAALRQGSAQHLILTQGVTRVSVGGELYSGLNADICVDGTSCLEVDGGHIGARIIRMGETAIADGAVFRMTAGTAHFGGYGTCVIVVGYGGEAIGTGSARMEILGGSFVSTGDVENANIVLGPRREGTLVVDGPTAEVEVNRLFLGWHSSNSSSTESWTNRFFLRNGGTARFAEFVEKRDAGNGGPAEMHLEAGGKMFTPRISTTANNSIAVFWSGTVWTQSAPSNSLFAGNVTVDLQGTDSALVIPSGEAAWTVPVAGSGWLRKEGGGTLRMLCDQFAWTGGLELAEGGLDVSGGALAVPLVVTSADAVLVASNAMLSAVTLTSGTLVVVGDNVFIDALDVPVGESAVLQTGGTVTIARLTGGGDLLAEGGGAFYVLDAGGFAGNASVANDGTVWEEGYDEIPEIAVYGDMMLSLVQDTTLNRLSFVGAGTFTVSGAYTLTVGEIILAPGVTSTLVFDNGTPSTILVGAVTGAGTLALPAGSLVVGEMGEGVSLDLLAGEVQVSMAAASQSPPAFEVPPAFWVDASDAPSMTLAGSALMQWRDWRGGAHTNYAFAGANAPTLLAPETALNGKPAVKFASPSGGSYSGMEWNERLENIRSVFFVIGAQEGGGQLLGDTSRIDFLRGEVFNGAAGVDWPVNAFGGAIISQRYANANRDGLPFVMNGVTRLDGAQKPFGQTGYPSAGYHLVSLRTTGDTCAKAFASERLAPVYNDRSGCQRLAEVLVFTNAVGDAEIAATEAYLNAKWFGGGVRVGRVRLGSATARFSAVGGALIVDTVEVADAGVDFAVQVTGVKKIETVEVTAPTFTAPPSMLPASASPSAVSVNELRLDGAAVSVDASSVSGTVRLWTLSGSGAVSVANASGVLVPGLKTVGGEEIALNTPAVPLEVYGWAPGNGFLTVGGCTSLSILSLDQTGDSGIRYAGQPTLPLTYGGFRKIGTAAQWTHDGNINASVNTFTLHGGNIAFDLNTGGIPFRINTVRAVGNNFAMTRAGTDCVQINTLIQTEGGSSVTLDAALFAGGYLPMLRLSGPGATITGDAPLTLNTLRTENYASSITLTLAPEADVTASNLTHTAAGSFVFPAQGTFSVLTLNPSDNCPIAVPMDKVTTVNALNVAAGGSRRLALVGGVLRILESASAGGYIVNAQGIIFPDGTVLDLAQWDARRDFMLDVGATGVVTVNSPATLTNAMTLANGSLLVGATLDGTTLTLPDGTAMDISGGQAVTLDTLAGNGTVTLGAGATLDVLTPLGSFSGTLVNNGGTATLPEPRVKIIPTAPVVEPTFWVDASQEGSFATNAQNHLVWLDKRTARDGTAGLMSAVSTNANGKIPAILTDQLNGLPVVDFGTLGASGDEKGMGWSRRLTDVRAVHWVIGAHDGGGMLLGDYNGGHIDYFRYNDQADPYNFGFADPRTPLWSGGRFYTREFVANVVDGVTCMNGEVMTAPAHTEGFPSRDYHLLSLRTAGPTWAAAFASERINNAGNGQYGDRSGAQRLGEVLVYDAVTLTPDQQKENDIYLRWKWWGERLHEGEYRLDTEDLLTLRGSGTFGGTGALARELAPGAGGMRFANLHLDFYPDAADTGAIIRLDTLPAAGAAAITADGDIRLSPRGTVILGELRPGAFKVLEALGELHNAAAIANWALDLSAFPTAPAYNITLSVRDACMMLDIRAKGTVMLLK